LQHAAEAGQFKVIKFGLENGFPYDHKIFEACALNGHLEILEYVYTRLKKSINNEILYNFLNRVSTEMNNDKKRCLEFMITHSFPICKKGLELLDQLDIVDFEKECWIQFLEEQKKLPGRLFKKYMDYKKNLYIKADEILENYISKDIIYYIFNKY
jgi:hypothetical protein